MKTASSSENLELSSSLPWKTRLAVSILSTFTDFVRRPNGTINRRFLRFFELKSPSTNNSPVHGVSSFDYTLDSSRNLWFRTFVPVNAPNASLPVVVFFHGGGFAYLSPDTIVYNDVCRKFARKFPAVIVSVNYRLSPEHRYPCQYDDGFDVVKFLDQDAAAAGILPKIADVSKCFFAGDSAGANLAHHVAIRVGKEKERFQNVRLLGLISIQPFFGGEERTESELRLKKPILVSVERTDWMWKAFLPKGSNRDHEAANPKGMDITAIDYPATVVIVGGLDPLQDWQRRYYERLKESGKEATLIEYPNMIHAFYVFPELPEASRVIELIKDFVTQHC
ncbi:hypothetical protein UlMin_013634 [Ulmus minor]